MNDLDVVNEILAGLEDDLQRYYLAKNEDEDIETRLDRYSKLFGRAIRAVREIAPAEEVVIRKAELSIPDAVEAETRHFVKKLREALEERGYRVI